MNTSQFDLPQRRYLSRGMAIAAVGGVRQLQLLEAEGVLRRYHPCGLKHARYLRAEIVAALDGEPTENQVLTANEADRKKRA